METIEQAVETFAARFLGRHGIVSVTDAYDDDGSAFLLVLTTKPDETRDSGLPGRYEGFSVVVRETEPLWPH